MEKILLVVAIAIIVGMSIYLYRLLKQIQAVKNMKKKAVIERFNNVKQSLVIVTKAMIDGTCELSEGVYRLKPLADVLGFKLHNYQHIFSLYQVINEMPILDERRKLKKKERQELDAVREQAIETHKDAIKEELPLLLQELEGLCVKI